MFKLEQNTSKDDDVHMKYLEEVWRQTELEYISDRSAKPIKDIEAFDTKVDALVENTSEIKSEMNSMMERIERLEVA